MKRILIVGSGGSGKSTLSAQLGKRLGLPVIHMDAEYWQPGWVEPGKPEWQRRVDELCRGYAWVMDGNYSGTLASRLAVCDTVIFLDMPRLLCLWRVTSRGFRYLGVTRPDMAEGCPERWPDLVFLKWIWNYPEQSGPRVLALLREHASGKQVVRLRSRREVQEFLAGL